mgnify:CR=1 FL=1
MYASAAGEKFYDNSPLVRSPIEGESKLCASMHTYFKIPTQKCTLVRSPILNETGRGEVKCTLVRSPILRETGRGGGKVYSCTLTYFEGDR